MLKTTTDQHRKRVTIQREATDFDRNEIKLQHLAKTSLWIFVILSGFCFKTEILHFRTAKLTFCICVHIIWHAYHGNSPSLPFVTNADVDMSAVYADMS